MDLNALEDILIPIFICVVLPVSIVLIVYLASINSDNKRAKVLIKAIESNNSIDADKLAEALRKPRKTQKEILYRRLLRGCIYTLVGTVFLIIGIYNYATLASDMVNDSGFIPSLVGGISLAIGISYLIVYFVTRKEVINSDENK